MRARATRPGSAEKTVRDIRRATRRQYSTEEKICIVLEGLRGRPASPSFAARHCAEHVLRLVEGVSGSRQAPTGWGYRAGGYLR